MGTMGTRRARILLRFAGLLALLTFVPFAYLIYLQETDAAHQAQKRALEQLSEATRRRLCAHHANSLDKFFEAATMFRCIEIDVMLDGDGSEAFVYHPGALPPEPRDRPLRPFLAAATAREIRLWLDMKNLSDANVHGFMELMGDYSGRFEPGDLLVEVAAELADSYAVRVMHRKGFLVSYYLPTEQAARCGTTAAPAAPCAELRARTLGDVARPEIGVLSFDFVANKDFVDSLPKKRLPLLATWDLQSDIRGFARYQEIDRYHMYIIPFTSRAETPLRRWTARVARAVDRIDGS
jgi:hypothetical protein